MHESDTYLAILEEGEEKGEEKTRREDILAAEERLGPPTEAVRSQLSSITDLARLKRMHSRAMIATSWQEILDTQ